MSNVLNTTALVDTLKSLAADREQWENGIYKQSNEVLYGLLDRCVTLYNELAGNRVLIKQLNAVLEELNLPKRSNTSLSTKIVRYVFGDCGKRAYAYARVIEVAAAEKPENQSMSAFVTIRGGIEAIRKNLPHGQATATELNKKYAEEASRFFADSPALATRFAANDALKADSGSETDYTAALVRAEKDGTFSIVFCTSNERLVKSLLIEGGKRNCTEQADHNVAAEAAVARDLRDAQLDRVAA